MQRMHSSTTSFHGLPNIAVLCALSTAHKTAMLENHVVARIIRRGAVRTLYAASGQVHDATRPDVSCHAKLLSRDEDVTTCVGASAYH